MASANSMLQLKILLYIVQAQDIFCDTKMAVSAARISEIISKIQVLTARLPINVALGQQSDRLYEVLTTMGGETSWETFNRRFNILFGEDC